MTLMRKIVYCSATHVLEQIAFLACALWITLRMVNYL